MPLPPPPSPGPPPGAAPQQPAPRPRTRSTGLAVAAALLALALAVVSIGAVAVISAQRSQIAALTDEVATLEDELERAQAEAEDPAPGEDPAPDDSPGLLDGLGEGLGELLEGLFGDDGPGLGDLLPDEGLAACLQPSADLDALPSGGPAEQLPEITERVEELRELEFPDPVAAQFAAGTDFEADLRARVEADLDRTELEHEQRRLVALGAIPADTDLAALQLDLVSGQAAGFYDTVEQEIVVRVDAPDAPLRPVEQVALAHELEHALSDAVLGLPLGADARGDADADRAALALVEGGATVLMQHYAVAVLDLRDQLMLGFDPSIAESQAQLDAYPHHLRRGLLFPYEEGLAFTCRLLRDGGWAAVDEAYGELPVTSAQILWPQRYLDGEEAVAVPEPADPSGDWEEAGSDTLGAAELSWLFEAPGGQRDAALSDPLARAAAWAGGAIHTWTRADDTAVAIRLAERDEAPSRLCDSVHDWYVAAFPDGDDAGTQAGEALAWDTAEQAAVLACDDDGVALGIGPDVDSARALSR